MSTNVCQAIGRFVDAVQGLLNEHYATLVHLTPPTVVVEYGRRYAKLVLTNRSGDGGQRSVYCFVDRSNGDILKAATWRAPAKGVRGSVLSENPLTAVTPYGAVYFR